MKWLKIQKLMYRAKRLDEMADHQWFLVSDTAPLSRMKSKAKKMRAEAAELAESL